MKASPDTHIRTDHLLKDLGRRTVSGGFVTTSAQGYKFFLNIASAVVLARLLSPNDFGLVAMAGALMPILRTFREGGFSTATVQKEGLTHAQVSNLFWINLAIGGAITLLGIALAPTISWFYNDERLTAMTVFLSLSFLVSGSAVQHLALLNRQMRFKAVAFVDTASVTLGFLLGVLFAWLGFGYWSLVAMQLGGAVFEALLTWLISGWLPQLPKRSSGTRPLLRFGASMTFYIFLRRLAASVDVIFLGKLFGADTVGLYSRAQILLMRPLDQFISPFHAIFVPALSRLQNQPDRYRQMFIQAYEIIALLSFTFAGLMIGLSEPLVLLLLGSAWSDVVPIFAVLTIAALYIPLSGSAIWLLSTQARSRDLLVMGVIGPLLTVLSVVIGAPFGATALALSFSLVGLLVRLPVQYHITGRSGPVSTKDLWGVFLRHIPLWAAVASSTWMAQNAVSSFPLLGQLMVGILVGTMVGALTIAGFAGLREEVLFIFTQGRKMLRERIRSAP